MMAEPRRCEVHGTVLTASGACILCERRARTNGASSSRAMMWLLVGVVGLAIAAAGALRIRSALADRAESAAARRDETVSAASEIDAPAAAAAATTAAPTGTPAIESTGASLDEPRASRDEARRAHERLVAEAERSVQIDLYGEGWCPSCRKARGWLDANAIPYTYRDTSDAVNKHTMRALNPNSTIPTIDVEGQVVVGFSPQALRAAIRRAADARVAKNPNTAAR